MRIAHGMAYRGHIWLNPLKGAAIVQGSDVASSLLHCKTTSWAMMMLRRTVLGAAAATSLGSAAPWAWGQAKAGAGRKVVLGQSVPLTGAASEIGLAFAAGAKLYVDAFNARKPGPGFSMELRQVDDGYDPAKAGTNAKKLLADGADLLFGFVGTASSDAGEAVAKQQGAIFFAPFAASDTLRDADHANVFHVRPSMADEAFKMVRHCATLGQERIAVLAEDDAMGRAGLAAVRQAMAELKLPPLAAWAFVPVNSDKVDAAVATLAKAPSFSPTASASSGWIST